MRSNQKSNSTGKALTASLWTVQILLAALFLLAGGMKLVTPTAALAQMSGLSGAFMKFIGVAEVLGAVGLILPRLLRIQPALTPWAAAGLAMIMIGAVAVTDLQQGLVPAIVPLVVGLLAAFTIYGCARVEKRLAA